jgi:hypothetical protein
MFRYTDHAIQRMSKRHVTESQVELIYTDPQDTWPDASGDPTKRNYVRRIDGRKLKVTVKEAEGDEDPLVITVVDLTYDESHDQTP